MWGVVGGGGPTHEGAAAYARLHNLALPYPVCSGDKPTLPKGVFSWTNRGVGWDWQFPAIQTRELPQAPVAATGHCHLLALTTFCRSSGGCQMESSQGKTPAAGMQKPPLCWAIRAANQHGAAGYVEGTAAWQAACMAWRRGTLGCPVQGHAQADSGTSSKKGDYDPPHKRIWGQILSRLSQRGWSSGGGRCPSQLQALI